MNFVKLQATGNDFILIDARGLERGWGSLAKAVCERRFGVGGDGLILLLTSKVADFRMRIFNSDGSEAEVCGNGLRCFARYAINHGLAEADKKMTIETMAGVKTVELCPDGRFRVNMGTPRFSPEDIPVAIVAETIPIVDYPVQVGGRELLVTVVSLGNPHGVCFVEELSDFPLAQIGPLVEHHELFPQRLNFEIARVVSRRKIEARVWERGAGETLSCGSGACAVAIAAQVHDYVDSQVDIVLPGGRLGIEWPGKGEVYLSGGAELVFTGEWPERDSWLEEE